MRRQILQTQGAAIFSQEARTVDELIAAIGRVVAFNANGAVQGAEIRLCAPMTISSRITLPSSVPGLSIKGNPAAVITCGASMASMFSINADRQSLRDLYVSIDDAATPMTYLASIDTQVVGCAVEGCSINVSIAVAGGGLVNAPHALTYGQVKGNHSATVSSKTIINGTISQSSIIGNTTAGSSTMTLIGERCAIVGNTMSNGTIDTSASGGNNTIVANTFVGLISAAGSDQVGLNT